MRRSIFLFVLFFIFTTVSTEATLLVQEIPVEFEGFGLVAKGLLIEGKTYLPLADFLEMGDQSWYYGDGKIYITEIEDDGYELWDFNADKLGYEEDDEYDLWNYHDEEEQEDLAFEEPDDDLEGGDVGSKEGLELNSWVSEDYIFTMVEFLPCSEDAPSSDFPGVLLEKWPYIALRGYFEKLGFEVSYRDNKVVIFLLEGLMKNNRR